MCEEKIILDQQFKNFAKFGDAKSDGRTIKLSNIDRWFKQAEIMNKKLTMTDTGVEFNKFKVKAVTYQQFSKFLNELVNGKKLNMDEIKEKLECCGLPGAKKKPDGGKPGIALPRQNAF
ncbi:hypothetical protein NQ317_012512 [Molorchus minor]|uniref:Uncharacterized protein n=1 Tax=Molorchus minor TaxID=1323400 RepID=A0ABQ9K228_9CUCU|nr:hypothetical protein NQ317_012512 [Molorchus minor]